MAALLVPPKAVNLKNSNNLNYEWKQFKQNWNLYELASGIKEKSGEIRVATFLHIAGNDILNKYNGFTWNNEDEKKDLDIVLRKLDADCLEKTNLLTERYKFCQRKQGKDESCDNFITELRLLVTACDYHRPEEALRDQFIFNIYDRKAREKLFDSAQDNYVGLTVEKAVSLVKNYETMSNQRKELIPEEVLAVSKTRESNKRIDCNRCGYKHLKMKCPAYGKKCNYCDGMNHFSKVCTKKKPKVYQVEKCASSDDESIEEISHELI